MIRSTSGGIETGQNTGFLADLHNSPFFYFFYITKNIFEKCRSRSSVTLKVRDNMTANMTGVPFYKNYYYLDCTVLELYIHVERYSDLDDENV